MALLKTSGEAREFLEKLRRSSGVRPNLWARAAMGYSLSLPAEPEKTSYDSDGTEFNERTFFGEDKEPLMALMRQRMNRIPEEPELGSLIKAHVERGLRYFWERYERLNKRGDELMLHLLSMGCNSIAEDKEKFRGVLPELPQLDSFELRVTVGTEERSGKAVPYVLNGAGGTPHLAIMGRNGTGKTRTGLKLLSELSEVAPYRVPFLIFDYAKGDIADNLEFAGATDARIVKLPDEVIPLAPLSLTEAGEHARQLAARRFRNTIKSVVRLGPKQNSRCLDLITQLYRDFDGATPDLSDLVDLAEQEYAANTWSEDSLLSCIKEFAAFPLFQPAGEEDEHAFFRKSHIIDIHKLPEDLRKLTVFLVLDRLYSEIMTLPDAQLDQNENRQQRLLIVIDEAHHYLPCKQPTLQDMVREVRSKGVGVWLFSQSPDDFGQPKYNFAREMGLSIVFSCLLEKPRMLEALLGGRIDPTRLSQLPTGVALSRIPGSGNITEIRLWTPESGS